MTTMFIVLALSGLIQAKPPDVKPKPSQAELVVEAGLVMQSGDVKRAARMPLRLMDSDFIIALQQSKVIGGSMPPSLTLGTFEMLRDAASIGLVADPESRKAVTELETILSTHTIATATTDFDGKATLTAPPGKYFVLASLKYQNKTLVWNLPAELAPGPNRIILDQNNTLK